MSDFQPDRGKKYADLPRVSAIGMAHAWDAYGPDDVLGSLNRVDPECVRKAVSQVQDGSIYSLNLPIGFVDPPLFGRAPVRHSIIEVSRNEYEDKLDELNTQSSTQWDGFGHIRCREFGFWGGRQESLAEAPALGIDAWARRGIVGRGVLLDVDAMRNEAGSPLDHSAGEAITPADLQRAASAQNVEIRDGDVLCVRTGWVQYYRQADEQARAELARTPHSAGLVGSEEMAELLWNWGVAAVAADNPAVERIPGDPADGSLHRRLIPLLGIVLGELFDFDALAQQIQADGRSSFLFVSAPMNLPSGVASPANALAIR